MPRGWGKGVVGRKRSLSKSAVVGQGKAGRVRANGAEEPEPGYGRR